MTATVMTHSVFTQTENGFDDHMFRNTRVYLECPYHERVQVKELGARWDHTQRRWYAPPGTNLEPLIPWMKERIYLRCSIEDQETIENLGARYDTTVCGYYILDGTANKEQFARWLP